MGSELDLSLSDLDLSLSDLGLFYVKDFYIMSLRQTW